MFHQTNTLTTGIDALTGTAGDDTFTGLATTFSSADTINGGAGNDTLTTIIAGSITPALTSIENVIFTATAASTINFAGSTDLATVKSIGSTAAVTISGIATSDAVTIQNTTAAHTLTYSSVTGSADAATVAVNNYVSGAATAGTTAQAQVNTYSVPVPNAATNTVTVNVGGVATTVITGATSTTHGNAIAAAINQSAGQTIAVFTAAADATTTAGSLVVTAPTAGTALPAITFSNPTVAANAPTVTFTTANVVGVAGVDAGTLTVAGIETLSIDSSGAASTVALTSAAATTINVTGSANLTLSSALAAVTTTVNASTFTGALSLNHSDNAAVVTITGGTGNDTFDLGGTFVGMEGAAASRDVINGGAGTDTLILTSAVAVAASAVAQTGVTNIETLDIEDAFDGNLILSNFASVNRVILNVTNAGTDTMTLASGTTVEFDSNQNAYGFTIAGTGTSDAMTLQMDGFDLAAASTTTGVEALSINTGTVVSTAVVIGGTFAMTGSAGGTTTMTVTGVNSFDVNGNLTVGTLNASGLSGDAILDMGTTTVQGAINITGSGNADIIRGSAAADTIVGGAGADTINGLGGADVLTGGAGADDFVFTATTGGATITDFVTGTDDIDFNTALASIDSSGTTPIAAFQSGAAGTALNATTTVFELTGVTTAGSAANLVTALGATATNAAIDATDALLIVAYTATGDAQVWYFLDADGADIAAGELTLIATLTGVTADSLVAGDFI